MTIALTAKKGTIFKKITLFILMFLLIYGYESIFANTNRIDGGGQYKSIIDGLTTICFLCIVLLLLIRKKYVEKSLFLMLGMCSCIVISMLWNNDYTAGMILKIMIIVIGYGVYKIYGVKEFGFMFIRTMRFFAICSLVIYVIGIILFPLINLFPTITTVNRLGVNSSFANLGVSIVPYYTGLRFRNYSVFREPGVYQAFLNIALIFLLFVEREKNNRKDMVIFSIAIISTLSTTGIVAWLLIMVGYFFSLKNETEKVSNKTKLVAAIFVIASIVAVLFLPDVNSIVFSKLTNGGGSWYSRFNSISSNFHVFCMRPFFGVGITQLNDLLQTYLSSMNLSRYLHNTNTLLTQFSSYGVFFGTMYTLGYVRFIKGISRSIMVRILLGTAVVAILFGENFDTNVLFSILLFMGFDKKK